MEKTAILLAACGLLISAVGVFAQDTGPDTLKSGEFAIPDTALSGGDTTFVVPETPVDEPKTDPLDRKQLLSDTLGIWKQKTEAAVEDTVTAEPSIYDKRPFLSRGVGDEFKCFPGIVLVTHGTVGTPIIPTEYLNVAGTEIRLNGLPFSYNGLYRPYIIGADLDVIPWEILNDITIRNGRSRLSLGMTDLNPARSDVEVYRGAYGYSGTRWRFFQPIGENTKGYFTLGFKKTDPFYTNSDYDGYHVTGGVEREILGGVVAIDAWKHRAKTGLLSFDFLVGQFGRQSRGIDRIELNFKRDIAAPLSFAAAGLYHRSAQTVSGYSGEFKTKNDLGGGKGELACRIDSLKLSVSSAYYNSRLYGHPGIKPSVNIYEHDVAIRGRWNSLDYDARFAYEWAGQDQGAILPSAGIEYEFEDRVFAKLSFYRQRRSPDLYLWYYDDNVDGLGSGLLESYHFLPSSGLKSPLTSAVSVDLGWGKSAIDLKGGLTVEDIDNQIRLAYYQPQPGEYIISPVNFDDRLLIIDAGLNCRLGPLAAELSAAYRIWDKRYFDDGLEKGPALLGFVRIDFQKQFFVPELYLGVSLEMQASSRRDYRTMQIGLTDAFVVFQGRIVFKYKDFTFHLNEDNLRAEQYFPLYPYPGTPRSIWWGFRWEFRN